jgi:5-methylcytosine-specific restriction endonuclease McrA
MKPNKITLTCQRCGGTYHVRASRAGGSKYCSRACKTPPNVKACERCGRKFRFSPCEASYKRFCSRACAWPATPRPCRGCGAEFRAQRADQRYCGSRCIPAARVRRECERCGRAFTVQPNVLRYSAARFCSNACRYQRVTKKCDYCGKGMAVKTSRARSQRFCAMPCYARWQSVYNTGQRNPLWNGGRGASERRTYYNRRAGLRACAAEPITKSLLVSTYGHLCYICGVPLTLDTMTIDHVTPLSRGGAHTLKNVRPACKRCNCRKYNRPLSEFVCFI